MKRSVNSTETPIHSLNNEKKLIFSFFDTRNDFQNDSTIERFIFCGSLVAVLNKIILILNRRLIFL
ncbi:MAG: hypothetical protein ACW97X_11035, partial [Candidatus Hodarchaeales archaeon]